ncbi:MAG: DUF362 domain-containing protein [Treponema sp.]|nr:DUF362 domain-containing protein [Treponema sp.]
MEKTVALAKCSSYDFEKVYSAIKEMMALCPPPDVKGKTVLLKPNILYPKKPELCVCTNPVVVGASVKAFLELGAARVLVGESPAVASSKASAKSTGMLLMVEENGGEWADFNDSKVTVDLPEGKIKKHFDFASPFSQADVVVSLSKLKTHQFMSYTGAMKNLFGLVVGLEKSQMHYFYPKKEDFAAYITDLNLAAKAGYAIMDAVIGMDGPGGPGSGDPIFLGFMAASQNLLALDCVCSKAVGYDPMEIVNQKDALERKVWLNSLSEIEIKGLSEKEIENKNFRPVHAKHSAVTLSSMLPPAFDKIASFFLMRNPHFDKGKCIRCAKCIQICPPKVLSFREDKSEKGKHVVINRKDCIHCFCCHEICPADAIKLKKF